MLEPENNLFVKINTVYQTNEYWSKLLDVDAKHFDPCIKEYGVITREVFLEEIKPSFKFATIKVVNSKYRSAYVYTCVKEQQGKKKYYGHILKTGRIPLIYSDGSVSIPGNLVQRDFESLSYDFTADFNRLMEYLNPNNIKYYL